LRRFTSLASIAIVGSLSAVFQTTAAQSPTAQPARSAAELLRLSLTAEGPGLAEPFKGLTANGQIEAGLFKIRSTGVSTEPVRKTADAFLATLTEPQRAKTKFKIDDDEWRKWMNQSFYVRQGMGFIDMTEPQREAAFGLLRAALSAKGLKLTATS